MLSLRQLKNAHTPFRYAVFGYLRRYEKTDKSVRIPIMVKYICLNYYLLHETFTKHGDKIKLNEDRHIATKYESDPNTVYGNVTINIDVGQGLF